jgi:hypothetical protein
MTVMPEFDPLAILDKVNRISDAEIARSKAEWRALYGELDPFAVAPFVKYGAPLSNEGRRLASLLNRTLHGRLPVTADIRFELVQFLSARLSDPTKDIDQRRYGMALYRHRQRLIALLECYSRRIKRGRARPTADGIYRSTNRKRIKAPCADCGIDTLQPGPDWYMVHDQLWRMAWPTAGAEIAEPLREILADAPVDAGGQYDFGFERCAEPPPEILCIPCLELRLGRALTAADFTDAPVNDGIREWQYNFGFER